MTFINVALRNHPEQHREQPEQQKKGNHILTVIAAYPNPIENIVLKLSKWTETPLFKVWISDTKKN